MREGPFLPIAMHEGEVKKIVAISTEKRYGVGMAIAMVAEGHRPAMHAAQDKTGAALFVEAFADDTIDLIRKGHRRWCA